MMKKIHLIFITILSTAVLIFICHFAQGEPFKYNSKGKRDPFVPLIGPDRTVVAGLEDVTSVEDITLEGIAMGAGGKRIAIINGEMVKEKDKVGVLEIKRIDKDGITISVGGTEHRIALLQEGGTKSEK